MRKYALIILVFTLFVSISARSGNVQERIDRLLEDELFETSQVGLMVYDLTADSIVYAHGERQMMRPASTMKVVTAVTALDRLGGAYNFSTSLAYTGTIKGRTLMGDLYCIGGFDPLFNDDDMKAFVESVANMGIDTVRGRLVADKSMKGGEQFGEGWCWDDNNPALSPLLVSKKDIFADRLIRRLYEAGIYVDVTVKEGITPNDADTICTRYHTIDQVLTRMMKHSDNLFAEAMFYAIAASGGYKYVKATDTKAIVRRLMNKIGIPSTGYRIADGSGLSLYNYVSPSVEVALLRYAFRNANIYMHLYPSLPIAGTDGTLKKRMKGTKAEANVHAKTGTLTGIYSLAGYCRAADGNMLAFCIINQGAMSSAAARAFQDKVCIILCE